MAKRLKRTSKGGYILSSGETITAREREALRSAVNSANRKRKRWLDRLPEYQKKRYKDFGIESDFIYRKKSVRLARFTNKKQFNTYLRSVQRISSGKFEGIRNRNYQENFKESLRKNFNSKANHLIRLVNKIDNKDFVRAFENGEIEEIPYVYYDPNNEKYNLIEAQLNFVIKKYGEKV